MSAGYDKRLIERLIRQGKVEEADYQKHLSTLPDLADQATTFEVEFEASDNEDADETADE